MPRGPGQCVPESGSTDERLPESPLQTESFTIMTTTPELDIQEITADSPLWPARVNDLQRVGIGQHVPQRLFVAGNTQLLRRLSPAPAAAGVSVTITGSRACTAYGQYMSDSIAGDLAKSDVLVISGGGFGIDVAAHRSALVHGKPCVAVLPSGLNRMNPVAHRSLLHQIAVTDGLLISAVEPDGSVSRTRLVGRNLLMAALSDATVIIEAGRQSTSLQLTDAAIELNRAVGAVPGPVTSATSAGCHELLSTGHARLIRDGRDVITMLENHYA